MQEGVANAEGVDQRFYLDGEGRGGSVFKSVQRRILVRHFDSRMVRSRTGRIDRLPGVYQGLVIVNHCLSLCVSRVTETN